MRSRRTDAAGNFAFDGLPPDLWFFVSVGPKGFPQRQVIVATSLQPQPAHQGHNVLTGPLDLVFATPREFPFRVVGGDTGQPMPKVYFDAGRAGDRSGNLFDSATTDAEGRGKILIPPGEYEYKVLPEYQTPYLVTKGTFTLTADGPVPPFEATLRPACVLEVTVVDADTGAGIADVALWAETTPGPGGAGDHRQVVFFQSWEVATRIFQLTRPKTDAAGKLQALIEPGSRQVGVGLQSRPEGWEAVEPEGQTIDGKPSETLHLTFPMRRRR